jgi:Ca2+:H+ antiporter
MTNPVPGPSLSDAGRLLVEAAQAEATGLGHGFVGLEHLLLVLLADPALAVEAERIRVVPTRDELRARLARREVPKGMTGAAGGQFGLSSQARRLLEAAERKAQAEGKGAPDRRWMLERILTGSRGGLVGLLDAPEGRKDGRAEGRKDGKTEGRKEAQPERAEKAERAERAENPDRGQRSGAQGLRQRDVRRERRPVPERPVRPPSRPPEPRPVPPERKPARKEGRAVSLRLVLLLAIPLSIALNALEAHPLLVLAGACLAVMPLAGYMGEATEHLTVRTGPAIGGLLNATFGNAAELIIAIVALRAGLVDLVKASITGSILGNLLLIMGLSFLAGGISRPVLRYNRVAAGASAGMLALAVVGLVFPALFHAIQPEAGRRIELSLSESVAVVLAVTYGFSLLFSLRTHRSLFSGEPHPTTSHVWAPWLALLVLGLATVGVVVESEILVHAVENVTTTIGLSETFLGLIVVPIIGNAAEHSTAVLVARKGQMDLALQIALGSSTQVALLVAPVLVLAGVVLGQPMDLVFTSFEVAALGLTTVITAIITLDGESHWFEGVQLLATYALVGATAFFL